MVGGKVIKKIKISTDLISEFEFAALENTENGIETGALLCGPQADLKVTHLVFPKQTGFPTYYDVNSANADIEYLEYLRKRSLVILG